MPYDKDKNTISFTGDLKKDMESWSEFWAETDRKILSAMREDSESVAESNSVLTPRIEMRLTARPDSDQEKERTRISRWPYPKQMKRLYVIFGVVWTVYVFYRSSGFHELLGIELEAWDKGYLLVNWLGVPIAVLALIKGILWALHEK